MAARAEDERDERPASTTPTRTHSSSPAPVRGDERTEVSLTQFRAQFPWLVSVGQGG